MARASKKAEGVFAIIGADSFLAEEALERILTGAVGTDRTDAVEVLRGEEATWARVLDAARTRSLFSLRRAVVVRGADALKGSDDGLAEYLADPTPGVTLVLLAAKPDKRRAVWRSVVDASTVVSAEPLKGRALRSYVADALRRRTLAVEEDAVEELLERVGQDLRRLMGEVDKIEAYAGESRRLTATDVAAVLGKGMARPLYRLGDAMMARRAGEVLELAEEILDEGETPLRILATLHRVLRQVRGVRALRAARASRDQVASRLGVPPFKVGDVMEAAGRWSDADLRAAFVALGRADRGVKTGVEPRLALTSAVVEACASPPKGTRAAGRG